MGMKYLIIGAGGTGACLGAFLASKGKEVTFIARGSHLRAMRENGLVVKSDLKGTIHIKDIKVCDVNEYEDKADVIFVCVKGYSLTGVMPIIQKASHRDTVTIPILNLFGTGDRLAKQITQGHVLDGCIYIIGYIEEPGVVVQSGSTFKVVYGPREDQVISESVMEILQAELEASGIKVMYSKDIKKDTFQKYSFISSYAACGAYFDCEASEMQESGIIREMLIALQEEIKKIGEAMGIKFDENLSDLNMKMIKKLPPETTASMQKDIRAGKQSELDGLVFEVVRMGEKLGVETPWYNKVIRKFN